MRGPAALAGGVAMTFAILVAYLASVTGLPFPPVALAQAIVEALPGAITVPLIELLQYWAQRLLVVGVLALFLVAGIGNGLLAVRPRISTPAVVAVGALPWIATVVLAQLLAAAKVDLASDLLASAIGAGAYFAGLAFLLSAEHVATPAAATRRRALLAAVGAAAVVAVASSVLGGTVRAARGHATSVAATVRRLRTREAVAAGDPAFEGIGALTRRITRNEDHYVVDTALIKPAVDTATWKLEVAGHVERPFSIGYEELLDMEAVERPHTLECISNEIGGDLTSTALWSGVPMKDLLDRAGVKAGAYDAVLTSVDGYTDSIRIAKALDPDTLVAYLMNGYTVPQEHGFPARALIPGIYGMKNVKWLAKIEVVPFDFQGYWQERGWSDVATYNTHVRIDTPASGARLSGAAVTVAGIAFAGQRGIARVEVSGDGGATWSDAVLEPAVGRHTWRRWRFDWSPSSGKHRLVARATDGDGTVQTSVARPPFPSGSTGLHTLDVTIA
jgi:DMSO/TMAO reductase YedYZ molybdopterin-dependent catalytic subunit